MQEIIGKCKHRLKEEGNETVTNCNQLKFLASDGKQRLTDVANTEDLFRLIQSVPSKKAEPFKVWLAQIGNDSINELQDQNYLLTVLFIFIYRKVTLKIR